MLGSRDIPLGALCRTVPVDEVVDEAVDVDELVGK